MNLNIDSTMGHSHILNILNNANYLGVAIVVIGILWGLFVTIFWMVVGWRAMRAHEKLSDHHMQIAKMATRTSEWLREKNNANREEGN